MVRWAMPFSGELEKMIAALVAKYEAAGADPESALVSAYFELGLDDLVDDVASDDREPIPETPIA